MAIKGLAEMLAASKAKKEMQVQDMASVARSTQKLDKMFKVLKAPVKAVPKEAVPTRLQIAEEFRKKYNIPRLTSIEMLGKLDESQKSAIDSLARQQYGCITGAAGTGKTTVLQCLIDTIIDQVGLVDIEQYGTPEEERTKASPKRIPSIALTAYTGKATQQVKKNLPKSWWPNAMTSHRLLAFHPEFHDVHNEDGVIESKMRFVPFYTSEVLLPWSVIIIDEAGMLSIDQWENIWAACPGNTRIYMVGDINQLPPVHGLSVFGFALQQWPSYELTTIHRQENAASNAIVDNAWRILAGKVPTAAENFALLECSTMEIEAQKQYRNAVIKLNKAGLFDPFRDAAIVATNGKQGSRGEALGCAPLNQQFSLVFNKGARRLRIDAGRSHKVFAVGDKVMATRNDYALQITNGMTGRIVEIFPNAEYIGDRRTVGDMKEIQEYSDTMAQQAAIAVEAFDMEMALKDLKENIEAKEKHGRNRGLASHTVKVDFGLDDEPNVITFRTLAEVHSIDLAYAITCHKSQGSEYPTVVLLLHNEHAFMYYREWLYTAVTRASERVFLIYNRSALVNAVKKQRIKGSTLAEKVEMFMKIQDNPMKRAPELPAPREIKDFVE